MTEINQEDRVRVLESAKAFFNQYLVAGQLKTLTHEEIFSVLRCESDLTTLNVTVSDVHSGYRFFHELFLALTDEHNPFDSEDFIRLVNSTYNAYIVDGSLDTMREIFSLNVPIVVWLGCNLQGISPYAKADFVSTCLGINKPLFVYTLAILDRMLDKSWINSSDMLYALEYTDELPEALLAEIYHLSKNYPNLSIVDIVRNTGENSHPMASVLVNLLLISQMLGQKKLSGINNRYEDIAYDMDKVQSQLPLFSTLCVLSEQVAHTSMGLAPCSKTSYDFNLTIDKIDSIGYSIKK